jgi:hypothetical protein
MGQGLVEKNHKDLHSETSGARLLTTKQVPRLNIVAQGISAKPLIKERDCTPLLHNNTTEPTYTLSSRKCMRGELYFSPKSDSLHHCTSSEMMVVPSNAVNAELRSREEKIAVEVSLLFLTFH